MSAATPVNAARASSMLAGARLKSCTMFAATADGEDILTIEGLAKDGKLHSMQAAFQEHHGCNAASARPA